MQRALWTGTISFGLVHVSVRMHKATSDKAIKFKQINPDTGNTVGVKRVDKETGKVVDYERLIKGYEIAKDTFIEVDAGELETVAPEKTKAIVIEMFCDPVDIDPKLYKGVYYLAPGTEPSAGKTYSLFIQALERSGKTAIGKVVIRSKEQLVAIRPGEDGILVMSTLAFADEVRSTEGLINGNSPEKYDVGDAELDMAGQLIDQLSGVFDATDFRDEYREQVLEMLQAKADGIELDPLTVKGPELNIGPELMEMLSMSVNGKGKPSKNGVAKAAHKTSKRKAKK